MSRFVELYRGLINGVWEIGTGLPRRLLELLGQLLPEGAYASRIRGLCYRPFLGRCGRNFQVALHVKLECPRGIEVGDDVYIAHGSWLSGFGGGIRLDDQVMLGPYVTMVSAEHGLRDGSYRFAAGARAPIRIGRGTWIAAHATITSGVRVGCGCLIAAGAVVTRDVEDGSVVGGVPARPIGTSETISNGPDR